jgi:transcriptional regulator with PAS, ATPase and Fis domain
MIIGESQALKNVLRLVERASEVESTVLITGESGTGKELIAKAIHLNSNRKKAAFITVNCGAISEGLIESELFGHVRGSFTSAYRDKRGLFERADKGTILLDEIGELKPDLQVRLLRVLQSGEIEKVGAEETQKINVRVIAATNQRLDERIRQGSFREDLYYRLNVIRIHVPPLRERKEDVPLLVNYFLQKLNNKMGKSKEISEDALDLMGQYDWPGNIRELVSELERAIATSASDILEPSDFSGLVSVKNIYERDDNLIRWWIEEIVKGQASWDDVRKQFGAAGDSRKKIIEGIILLLKQETGHRPSGTELANTLKISRNYLNQVLSNLNLQLKNF